MDNGGVVGGAKEKKRLFFVDNLRILLIGSIVFGLFLAINQSFFMGFFFMISGYFTPGSYDGKGARRFFKDRLPRLGVHLLFYIIFILIINRYLIFIKHKKIFYNIKGV